MRLLKRLTLNFMLLSGIVVLLGGLATYWVTEALINEEVQETLESEKAILLHQIQQNGLTSDYLNSWNKEIMQLSPHDTIQTGFSDTSIFISGEEDLVPFTQLVFIAHANGNDYQVSLRRSNIEKDDVILGITVMMVLIFAAMILLLNGTNYWNGRQLWQPFYLTLDQLKRYQLTDPVQLKLPDETIEEFNLLNQTLNIMAQKIQDDYLILKEYSETMAHEMQTPLAIMRSKLDLVIQDQTLSPVVLQSIQTLYGSVNRMSRLNQTLNLLTKIDNLEFKVDQTIALIPEIEGQLADLAELIQMKQLSVSTQFESELLVELHPLLAETLISNLLANAIKHNVEKGWIHIATNQGQLVISNSGEPLHTNPQELFRRFKKDRAAPGSPGLGLSIVETICRQNGLKVSYQHDQGKHRLSLLITQ